ncbi:MAG: hypothetical protein JWP14_3375 [Frankiales bacterium]|nr:hypothetical protein [Frankiales bacterium]
MADYAALAEKKNELIRKGLEGSAFIAKQSADTIDEAALFLATNNRTVADGVTTSASTHVTSASAAFATTDVGGTISGTGIPVGATIIARVSATEVVISAAATASGTGVSVTVKPLAGLKPLPTGYGDLGHTTKSGAQFARATSESNVPSWGSTSPTRSDVTGDTTTCQITAQETNVRTLGLYTGIDVAALIPAAATGGSVMIEQPDLPNPLHYRLLVVAVDLGNDGEIYVCRYMPNAKVTGYENQSINDGDNPIEYGVTFTAYKDSTEGFTQAWLFGGPGWRALLDDMGFPAEA